MDVLSPTDKSNAILNNAILHPLLDCWKRRNLKVRSRCSH